MSGSDIELFDERWLSLREPADAAARSTDLVQQLRAHLNRQPGDRSVSVLDLGSGTGSTARWLAPLLPGPQQWLLLDHNADLLAAAVQRCASLVDADADGVSVQVRTRTADLSAADLAGTSVVTASALLDLLTQSQVADLAARCAKAGAGALLTLSVAGRVSFDPPHAADAAMGAAFDAHQRRHEGAEALLGPDAVGAAVAAFEASGFVVRVAESMWRLGPSLGALTRSWLDGWLSAAAAQDPALADHIGQYRDQRLAQLEAGELRVAVAHYDLLAIPI